MTKLQRAADIYRAEGPPALATRGIDWSLWKAKSVFLLDSEKSVSVSGISATFVTETRKEHSRFQDLMGKREVLVDLLQELKKDDIFYDVGANVGMYSCLAGQKLSRDSIIAFEPHPGNAARLRENLKLNNVSAQVLEVALSDKNGVTDLRVAESGEVGVGSHSISTGVTGRTVEINTVRGEEINANVPAPSVLKIDIEGAEMVALTGLQGLLSECRVLYCEVHPEKIQEFNSTTNDLKSFLRSENFKIETVADFEGAGYMLKCTHTRGYE